MNVMESVRRQGQGCSLIMSCSLIMMTLGLGFSKDIVIFKNFVSLSFRKYICAHEILCHELWLTGLGLQSCNRGTQKVLQLDEGHPHRGQNLSWIFKDK